MNVSPLIHTSRKRSSFDEEDIISPLDLADEVQSPSYDYWVNIFAISGIFIVIFHQFELYGTAALMLTSVGAYMWNYRVSSIMNDSSLDTAALIDFENISFERPKQCRTSSSEDEETESSVFQDETYFEYNMLENTTPIKPIECNTNHDSRQSIGSGSNWKPPFDPFAQ